LVAPFAGFGDTNPPTTGFGVVTIEPSRRFTHRSSERYGVYSVWLTYGLSPQWAKADERGFVEIPLLSARRHPGAYGYNWEIDPSPDGRFASACRVVRERALDLSNEEELRRPELDPPESAGQAKEFKELLRSRKAYPSGFVARRYRCFDWWRTNGVVVPKASETEVSLGPWDGEKPWRRVS